jgi:heme exporter protein D
MNWSEFFAQGGYAFYVWGSYLVAVVLLGGEVLLLVRRKRAVRRTEGSAPATEQN